MSNTQLLHELGALFIVGLCVMGIWFAIVLYRLHQIEELLKAQSGKEK